MYDDSLSKWQDVLFIVTELAFRKYCKSFEGFIEFCGNSRDSELYKIPNDKMKINTSVFFDVALEYM